jgi:predicted transcriptional regulator
LLEISHMTSITVPLSEEQLKELQELARQANVAPEEVARVGLAAWFRRPNRNFQEASRHVLGKNAELYRRLA